MGRRLLLILCLLKTPLALGIQWEYIHTKENVEVYRRDVANSELIAVKGRTVLPYARSEVLSLMIDHTRRHLWVDRLDSIERIKIYDGKLDAVSYYKVDLPWPVSDRDFVVRTRIWYEPKTDAIMSETRSVEGIKPEQRSYVRAFSHQSTVSLKKASDNETHIEVIASIDPRGNLPTWLVNYLQTKWAHVTLTRLKETLAKHPREVDPVFARLMSNQSSTGG